MCVDAPEGYRYNAGVEINDIVAFTQALLDTGTVNGLPLKTELSRSFLDTVKYQNRDVDVWKETPPDDRLYCKPKRFASQQESRLTMHRYRDASITDEVIFVDFELPSGIAREITV